MNTLPLASLVAALSLTGAASAATLTETFDTGLGNFDATVGNRSGGNAFGFSASSNAGSNPGELGGTFARTTGNLPVYTADASIGTVNLLDGPVQFNGVVDLTDVNADGSIFVGFFNPGNPTPTDDGRRNLLGLELREPSSAGGDFRVAVIYPTNQVNTAITIPQATDTAFTLLYTPNADPTTGGQLIGDVGGASYGFTLGGADAVSEYTAFGVGSGFAGSNDATRTASAFFDDLTYTVVPEPATAVLGLLGGALLLGRRRA